MRIRWHPAWFVLTTALATATAAEAQRATIAPTNARASETENLEFTIGSSWTYDAEIEFFTENITAKSGSDYQGYQGQPSWRFCVKGSDDVQGTSPDCEFGGSQTSQSAFIVHYRDDAEEQNETYRVVARVVRWETGRVTADGDPEVRECASTNCGRTAVTATIVDGDGSDATDREPIQRAVAGHVWFDRGSRTTSEGGTVSLTVRFFPASEPHGPASVRWATEELDEAQAATSGSDYNRGSGTLRFSACSSTTCPQQTRTLTIRTRSDNVRLENDEQFLVRLSSFHNAALVDGQTDWTPVTIADATDDGVDVTTLPELEISGDIVEEGATATVRLELDKRGGSGASIGYRIEPRDATDGCEDYYTGSGRIGLSGRTSATLSVRTRTDTCREGAEYLYVEFYDPVGIRGQNSAAILIYDVYSVLKWRESGVSGNEGDRFTFTVERETRVEDEGGTSRMRDRPHQATVSVKVMPREPATRGATLGEDLVDPGTITLRFGPGQTSKKVTIRTLEDRAKDENGDPRNEGTETFSLILQEPEGAELGATTTADGTIRDTDDDARVSIHAVTPSVNEGETAYCEIRVSKMSGYRLDENLRVRWEAVKKGGSGGETGTDFVATSGWIEFGRAAQQSRRVSVETLRTQENRGTRSIECRIRGEVGTGGDTGPSTTGYPAHIERSAAQIDIHNIDVAEGAPVWAYDQVVREGSTASFDVMLQSDYPWDDDPGLLYLTAHWSATSLGGGTADGNDFDPSRRGSFRFEPDGATSFRIGMPTRCDSVAEHDEFFFVEMHVTRNNGQQAGATIKTRVTIDAHSGCGGFRSRLTIADAQATEGTDSDMDFTVTLAPAQIEQVTVDWQTRDGSARAGQDYEEGEGTLTFRVGETRKTISIPIADDDVEDDGETFTVRLRNAVNAGIDDASATGTIRNTEPSPVETAVGRGLAGPTGISVADAKVEEAPGAKLAFVVTLSRAATASVTVDYATTGGSAEQAVDYAGTSGTLTFARGESTKTIEVAVIEDDHDEADETMTLTLSNPQGGVLSDGSATGTIKNRDPMPIGLIARFGRATAAHIVEQVEDRIDASRGGGFELRIGSYDLTPRTNTQEPSSRQKSPRHRDEDLLTALVFRLGQETSGGGVVSFWGRGARSSFSDREDTLSLSGDVRTYLVGADYAKGPLIVGVSMARSRGLGEYRRTAGSRVKATVTGLFPWIGYKATDRVAVWAVGGYGTGHMRLTPDGAAPLESDLSISLAATGVRGELFAGGDQEFDLTFKADALWAGTAIEGSVGPGGRLNAARAGVMRLRAGLRGSRAFSLTRRHSLTPSIEVGIRHDGGDAQTGAGIDAGAGLVAADQATGLAIDIRVRRLLVHRAEGFRERGVAVGLSWNPPPSTPLGFTARLAPSWGADTTGAPDSLWGRETMAGMARGGPSQGARIDGEIGYGLPVGDRFVGTLRIGFGASDDGRNYLVGYRLQALERTNPNFALGVDAERRETPMLDGTENSVLLRAMLRR